MIDFSESSPPPAAPLRLCRICGKQLSRWNKGEECFHHSFSEDPFIQDESGGSPTTDTPREEIAAMATRAGTDAAETKEERTEALLKAVCTHFALGREELFSPRRLPKLVYARQAAMYLLRTELGLSLPEIGRIFNRDHTTVLSACRKIEALCGSDAEEANAAMRAIMNK